MGTAKNTSIIQDSVSINDLSLFARIARWTMISTFFLIVLGSAVRATDSGLACPDWPLCFSQWVPQFDFQIFMEWIHRVDAAFVSILFLTLSYLLVVKRGIRKLFFMPLVMGFFLLCSQIILGGLTVLKLLEPKIVSMHLMNAILFLGILVWVSTKAEILLQPPKDIAWRIPKRFMQQVYWLCAFMLLQIFIGGMVSTTHSGLACADFPTCHGSFFGNFAFPEWLQMGHRYLAFGIAAWIIYLSVSSMGLKMPPRMAFAMRYLPALVLLQIVLGVINVFWFIPVSITVLHLANAVWMWFLLWRSCVEGFSRSNEFDVLFEDSRRNRLSPLGNSGEEALPLMAKELKASKIK